MRTGLLHSHTLATLLWVAENIGNLGKLRPPPMLKAGRTHGNPPHGEADFYPRLAQVGKDIIKGAIGGKSITDMACGADF